MTSEPATLLLIAAVFVIAGTVKGVIGLGMPTVSLGLLTATIGLQPAMALLLVPSFVTNLWQACIGGHGRELLRRLWPFLALATLFVAPGALLASQIDTALLSALLGLSLIAYAILGLTRPMVQIASRREIWTGPLVGAVNGVLTGLTGSFVVPGVLYMQALGLSRDQLVQAMGMLFTLSTLALGAALGGRDLLSVELAGLSAAAVIPAIGGMMLGQWLRRRLSEAAFRRVFYIALLLLGIYVVARALP